VNVFTSNGGAAEPHNLGEVKLVKVYDYGVILGDGTIKHPFHPKTIYRKTND
jgi:hypothetical protein